MSDEYDFDNDEVEVENEDYSEEYNQSRIVSPAPSGGGGLKKVWGVAKWVGGLGLAAVLSYGGCQYACGDGNSSPTTDKTTIKQGQRCKSDNRGYSIETGNCTVVVKNPGTNTNANTNANAAPSLDR